MADAMDMGNEVDEEADDIYAGILGEVGLEVQGAGVGVQKIAQPQAQ